jgi:hypothetical protein
MKPHEQHLFNCSLKQNITKPHMVQQNYFEKNLGSEMKPLEQKHLSNNRQRFSEQQMPIAIRFWAL